MKKTHFLPYLALGACYLSTAQQIYGTLAKATDSTKLAFVNIQSAKNTGTITGSNGAFRLEVKHTDTLTISCLGYRTKKVAVQNFKNNSTIFLEDAITHLNEVIVHAKTPDIATILHKVKQNININYNQDPRHYQIAYTTDSQMHCKDIGLVLKKASIIKKDQLQNNNTLFKNWANTLKNKTAATSFDFSADYYTAKTSSKIKIEKAIQRQNTSTALSVTALQKHIQDLALKYLDTTKTYKVKTGIFKIEDSLSIKNSKNAAKNSFTTADVKRSVQDLLKDSYAKRDLFINTKKYQHHFKGSIKTAHSTIYVIGFSPKKKNAKFTGTLHIDKDSYAVLQAAYSYAKDREGKKFQAKFLLGLRYKELTDTGSFLFSRDKKSNTYQLQDIKNTTKQYIYLKRALAFISNDKDRAKFRFSFLIETTIKQNQHIRIITTKKSSEKEIKAIQETKNTAYILNKK